MRICPKCGKNVSDKAKYCVECGHNIDDYLNKNNDLTLDFIDFDNANDLLDNMVNQKSIKEKLVFFEYEKYDDNKYIITKFIDNLQTNIIIPNGVVAIENNAFENSLITDVKLPEGLIKIGVRAFSGCKYLNKINIPSTVLRIDDEAFIDCVKLDLIIPNKVQLLGENYAKNTLYEANLIKKKQEEKLKQIEKERLEAELKVKQEQEAFNKLINKKINELKSYANENNIDINDNCFEDLKLIKDEKELKEKCKEYKKDIDYKVQLEDKDYLYAEGFKLIKNKNNENKGYEYLKKSADLGHILANVKLSDYLFNNKQYADAIKYLEVADKNGYLEASELLGKIYSSRTNIDYSFKDDKIAFNYFIKSADSDLYYSNHEVAYMYYYGLGTIKDYNKALFYLIKSSNQDHPESTYLLADMYKNGNGVEKDSNLAFKYYFKASELNHKYSMYCVGLAYKNGDGAEKDLVKAFEWFKKSSKYFDEAMFELGEAYYYGNGVTYDRKKAKEIFLNLAKKDYIDSYRYLGDIYYDFSRIDIITKSMNYYHKALDSNATNYDKKEIIYRLGEIYLQLNDKLKGIKYLTDAVNLGHISAMLRLASIYEDEKGGSYNRDEAKRLYEMAGNSGEIYGFYHLAKLYRKKYNDLDNAERYYLKIKDKIKVYKELKEIEDARYRVRKYKKVCLHCGGEFTGLFIKKCKVCGKQKDY